MTHRPWTASTPDPALPNLASPAACSHPTPGETGDQRLHRRYAEILQEVRVAQTGAQVLLAFLLTLAFTPRFTGLTDPQRIIYVTSLVLGAGATALLIAPAAFNRIVFHHDRLKHTLVKFSNRFAYFGLILLMLALSTALLLILDVVLGSPRSMLITIAITIWFSIWWYALPLWKRSRHPVTATPVTARPAGPTTGAHRAGDRRQVPPPVRPGRTDPRLAGGGRINGHRPDNGVPVNGNVFHADR